MEAKASAKFIRGSAQKARLVVDMIRGKSVNQALATLQFTNKRAADPVEACVRSAIANATEAAEKANVAVDPDDLWVKTIFVDKGPTKGRSRMRPAPQGRAYRERRHFCHVSVVLSSDEMPERKTTKGNGSSRISAQDGSRVVKKSAPAKSVASPTAVAPVAITGSEVESVHNDLPQTTAAPETTSPPQVVATTEAVTPQASDSQASEPQVSSTDTKPNDDRSNA